MSLQKFLGTISKFIPGDPILGREDAISRLNPDKIYVENVRAALGVSHKQAVRFCETAVRQGVFKRGIEVLCPDGSVGAYAESESALPSIITCWSQDDDGHLEEAQIPTVELTKIQFYLLNDEATGNLKEEE